VKAPAKQQFAAVHQMNPSKLRRSITHEAVRLLYLHEESEYYRAKQKASRRLCQGWVKPADLPTNAEIRHAVRSFARGRAAWNAISASKPTSNPPTAFCGKVDTSR